MKIAIVTILACLVLSSEAGAQVGNDFPSLPAPTFVPREPQFPVPGITGLILPQVISPEKKSAAGVAAQVYDGHAVGADSGVSYWCSRAGVADGFTAISFLVCGYMSQVAVYARLYAESNRLIQRDPFDPLFNYPADPVLLEPWQLGLWYLDDSHPAAGYSNWLVENTRAFYAWADMVRITADRAATCLAGNAHCAGWQLERLYWGMQNMIDLEYQAGSQILPGIRDHIYAVGLDGDMLNHIAWDARELARMLAEW